MPHKGMNKAILIGNVDDTPRYQPGLAGRTSRLVLRVRTVETTRTSEGVERERKAWHDVVVWGAQAERLSPRIVRGTWVSVEGRIVHSSWDGGDGRRRTRTEVHANELTLLDAREGPDRTTRDAA
jgi:single-strand DNA-binding protein